MALVLAAPLARDKAELRQHAKEVARGGLMDRQRLRQLPDLAVRALRDLRQRPELGAGETGAPLHILVVAADRLDHHPELREHLQHLCPRRGALFRRHSWNLTGPPRLIYFRK